MPNQRYWKTQISAAHKEREKFLSTWKENVRFRLGKPYGHRDALDAESNSLINVPIDASYTKAKIASLFSQVPAVAVTPKDPRWTPAAPAFAKELNEVIQTDAKVDRVMEECLADVINAAGIAAAKAGYEATFESVEVPAIDPSMLPPEAQMALARGLFELPMEKVKRQVDERFYAQRISPSNLLWPSDFSGSDFDEAPWLGYEGKRTVSQAKREFNLSVAQIEDVKGAGKLETLSDDESECSDDDSNVIFTEIFYKNANYDGSELYFDKIRRIVFIEGLDKPVVDEDLQWQRWDDETGTYIGVCKYPIRVLTLTYISDEAIPPSDSENGRPQVLEIMRSRAQIIQQRDHSKPIRWADTNKIDPQVLDLIQKGDWQGFIPTQGTGDRVIGEVARAMYPSEQWDFDRVIRADLQEGWQLGANQSGQFASGERSSAEAQIVQAHFATRTGFERAKVAKFFVGIAEVLAGLVQLYKDRPEELIGGEQSLQAMRLPINVKVALSIKPDSTVLLDANAQIDRLMNFVNLFGKSGRLSIDPFMEQIAGLMGLDPSQVILPPVQPQPEPPNVSYRFSGVEDLTNPLAVALLQKSSPVSPEEIQAAKLLIQDSMAPMQPPAPQPPPGPVGELPQEPNPVGRPTLASTGALPLTPNPDWSAMPRVSKRADDGELGG